MNAPLRLERPQLLTELAYERLREGIVAGELALGTQVSEAQLAQQMGISKTPVREALVRLKMDGLVEIYPQRGTFVFSLTPKQVEDVCSFRELIEVSALGLAMKTHHAQLVAGLQENVERMAEAQQRQDWRSIPLLDQAFHQVLIDQCDNAYLKQAYQLIAFKIGALRGRLPEENERVGHCQENHAAIVRMIRDGDVARAQTELALHIRDTLESYLQASRMGTGARPA